MTEKITKQDTFLIIATFIFLIIIFIIVHFFLPIIEAHWLFLLYVIVFLGIFIIFKISNKFKNEI